MSAFQQIDADEENDRYQTLMLQGSIKELVRLSVHGALHWNDEKLTSFQSLELKEGYGQIWAQALVEWKTFVLAIRVNIDAMMRETWGGGIDMLGMAQNALVDVTMRMEWAGLRMGLAPDFPAAQLREHIASLN